ncbi:UNVERIFIED_CONTAM: hypothetical protein Slati_2007900 [Sesamum latifolium]|uniref:B box-type domain-containing protein n=1 Tax=Sesamum latifolium TaxID=2727402 RepID=A0AAW2WMK3_9LAMI
MKKCELCKKVARMYCDSDRASLCWDCDSRVHTANFLVAKHTRTLLCHACQSPTPWTGSGPKLGPTVSVCDACVNRSDPGMDRDRGSGSGNTEDEEEDQHDDDDEEEENGDCVHEDDDDDSENQVVPLSLPPSSASSSSGSAESSGRRDGFSSSSFGFSNSSTSVESGRFSLNVCLSFFPPFHYSFSALQLPRFRVGRVISGSLHCSGRGKASTEEWYSEDEIMDVAIVESGRKKKSSNGWWADHVYHVKNFIF